VRIPLPAVKRKARIEIIPLIDIVFFLLATFVMVSLSMVQNQGISVTLPKAATGVPQEKTATAALSIASDGSIFLNKEQIDREALKRRLTALRSEDENVRVSIHADETADFGHAVDVMDLVRKQGIHKISIQTRGGEK
jgi:biopolymer transport protein ExbD